MPEIVRQADYYGLPERTTPPPPSPEKVAEQLRPPTPWQGPMRVAKNKNCWHDTNGHCDRIHEGDSVKVTYDPNQLGYGHSGQVIKDHKNENYTVQFDQPVNGHSQLTYTESELTKGGHQ